jgi:hypothetical protein
MAQCQICNAQDEDITEKMLKNESIDNTDNYFLCYEELMVCKDCYYKRNEWDNNEVNN